ncbi:unnamed protein product [Fusarium equiseti]|uniref:Nitrate assimilation regulatory protein nirA n=1 Tax=Fusarium equiseti TaxID=61235 RepID=A0A8J2IM69_FUSEQ|nr:unnamed protein product [Fusarium equiseti]
MFNRLRDSERHQQVQAEVINLLRLLPLDKATRMLQQLRDNPDLPTAISSVQRNTSLAMRPSDLRLARAVAPPTGSAAEFELTAQFSTAYPRLPPPPDIQILRGLLRQNENSGITALSKVPELLPSAAQGSSQTPTSLASEQYCDSRLECLNIGYWSKVPVSDEVAASLISFYIETDHNILGLFDADLFLQDLVECRQRFCSSFLVSALLSYACQSYTAIKPQTNEIRLAAFQEAEMLWQGERSEMSLISLAAMGLFSAACLNEGKDVLGQELAAAIRREAEDLGLCGDSADDTSSNKLCLDSSEWVRATSQIAWGVYSMLTTPILERVPLAFAEAKYQKLLVWSSTLQSDMKRIEGCKSDVMIFHIMFHVVATIILRPFIASPRSVQFVSLTSADSHPKAVYTASVNQLKDLVFIYRARYAEADFTSFFNTGLFTLSLALLEDIKDPSWQHYFYLCLRCWQDLYICYPIFRDVAKAFLSMAMEKSAISAQEAQRLLRGIEQSGEHHAAPAEAFTSFLFDPGSNRASEAQVHSMADRFEEMVVFDELINTDSALAS